MAMPDELMRDLLQETCILGSANMADYESEWLASVRGTPLAGEEPPTNRVTLPLLQSATSSTTWNSASTGSQVPVTGVCTDVSFPSTFLSVGDGQAATCITDPLWSPWPIDSQPHTDTGRDSCSVLEQEPVYRSLVSRLERKKLAYLQPLQAEDMEWAVMRLPDLQWSSQAEVGPSSFSHSLPLPLPGTEYGNDSTGCHSGGSNESASDMLRMQQHRGGSLGSLAMPALPSAIYTQEGGDVCGRWTIGTEALPATKVNASQREMGFHTTDIGVHEMPVDEIQVAVTPLTAVQSIRDQLQRLGMALYKQTHGQQDPHSLALCHRLFTCLSSVASPHGDPMQRVAFYFLQALAIRAACAPAPASASASAAHVLSAHSFPSSSSCSTSPSIHSHIHSHTPSPSPSHCHSGSTNASQAVAASQATCQPAILQPQAVARLDSRVLSIAPVYHFVYAVQSALLPSLSLSLSDPQRSPHISGGTSHGATTTTTTTSSLHILDLSASICTKVLTRLFAHMAANCATPHAVHLTRLLPPSHSPTPETQFAAASFKAQLERSALLHGIPFSLSNSHAPLSSLSRSSLDLRSSEFLFIFAPFRLLTCSDESEQPHSGGSSDECEWEVGSGAASGSTREDVSAQCASERVASKQCVNEAASTYTLRNTATVMGDNTSAPNPTLHATPPSSLPPTSSPPHLSPRDAALRALLSLRPHLLLLGEKESGDGSPIFAQRFTEALNSYCLAFHLLDALPRNHRGRLTVEREMYGRSIANLVACEGAARVWRPERLQQWVRRMRAAGFEGVPMPEEVEGRVRETVRDPYSIRRQEGGLTLCGRGSPLASVSLWTTPGHF